VFSAATERALDAGVPRPYTVTVVAPRAGRVRMRSGLSLVADAAWRDVRGPIDTLVVAGGDCRSLMDDRALLAWIRRAARHARRTTSVCTGAFLLAEAGLLDGRRATTHWGWTDELRRRYPAINVDPDALFVSDGAIHTSAGVTAGMDLALALVEADLGRAMALDVARGLVLFLKRPGGQSQFSAHLAAQRAGRGPLGDVPEWIVQHLEADLSVEALAARAGMSPRNFARVFVRELGVTPAKFVERARVELARRALEDGELPLASVAATAGFGTLERMRRTFHRHLRVVPQAYRNRFKAALAATG
jgi:transcriptional regulator GlxA family with amidase domain